MSRTLITLCIFGAFILAAVGYLIFFSQAPSGSPAVTASANVSSAEQLFLGLSDQLDSISFDTSVLSDPRFTALVDDHTPILPESAGRTDPFAPLSGSTNTSNTTKGH